tara:strand:+ start:2672 stop:3814 length:1143 start_codon:yes stop_codon:yes gene_type:complete
MTINRDVANIVSGPQKINRIHAYPLVSNGDMRIAQRGTSATGVGASNSYVTVDRWRHNFANTAGRLTSSQSTDVPTGQPFKHSLKLDCTTADTSIAANEFATIYQGWEGQELGLINKGTADCSTFTVIFWAKGTAKTYACELFDSDNNRQITKLFTVSTSWTKHVINFPADTSTDDDFTYDTDSSLFLNFAIHMGSDSTSGTLNSSAWADSTSANRFAGINSFFDSTDNELYLTGVQLELGTYAEGTEPPFQFEDQAMSLKRCQRYAQVVVDGSGQSVTSNQAAFGNGHYNTSNKIVFDAKLSMSMRVAPSAEVTTGSNYWAANTRGTTDLFDNIDGVEFTHPQGCLLQVTDDNVSGTVGDTVSLRTNNASAKLVLSADL